MREDVELGIYFWLITAAAFHDLGIFKNKTLQYAVWNNRGLLEWGFFVLNTGQLSFKSEPMVPCFNNIALFH